jgi:hypothetical protein
LIRFAIADNWGHRSRQQPQSTEVNCTLYVEEFFPSAVRQSILAKIPLDATIALDVQGSAGGQWTFRWAQGELTSLQRGTNQPVEVTYRLEPATFAAVVAGRLPIQEAFFARRIEIEGHLEKGLKLAFLFSQLVREFPYPQSVVPEAEHV